MCTRYVLLKEHLREILARLGIDADEDFISRYNIAPGSLIPVIRTKPIKAERESLALRWGLVPSWSNADSGTMLVNARVETVTTKPSFRDAIRKRRCLIPASGFYEWETAGRTKKPWLFRLRDEQPFSFAGLWDRWTAPDGTTLETCAFITTGANELMRPIHERIPVLLTSDQFEPWLDPRLTEPEQLAPLLQPPRADTMSAVAVSRHVSNVRNEGPACIAPAESDDTAGPQLSLGLE